MNLTIQIFAEGRWQDAASITFSEPDQGRAGLTLLGYAFDYALEYMDRDDERACSVNLPAVLMENYRASPWFSFLDDIIPSGASRRYWVNQLGLQGLPSNQQDGALLRSGVIAPVGNIRIKESLADLPAVKQINQIRFSVQDVVERNTDFLEYAQQMGAAGGGATGAGGEAPKLLLRCSVKDDIWIDTFQDDDLNLDQHYLVKFPRGNRREIDCDILRAEFHYYQELNALGMDTIDTANMRLIEGSRYPSLWLPRFDVDYHQGKRQLFGLESVYSVLGKAPGSPLNHFAVIRELTDKLKRQHRVVGLNEPFDVQSFVIEMVKRDFLNVIFSNSDNHGRNTALIKKPEGMWLAPIYDFAPMKADPEGVTRSTQWGAPFEMGGRFKWHEIALELADVANPDYLMEALRLTARKLVGLKARLVQRGVPDSIIKMPVMRFDHIDRLLEDWRLL